MLVVALMESCCARPALMDWQRGGAEPALAVLTAACASIARTALDAAMETSNGTVESAEAAPMGRLRRIALHARAALTDGSNGVVLCAFHVLMEF
mmetsp:Transcript_19217/g.28815  ORF Transcript_19217/g.28815 Transcript_19217/m.28815 type:complete len:95 (-) Transcript_19217:99-383(-)